MFEARSIAGIIPGVPLWQMSGSHSRPAAKHGQLLVLHLALQMHPGKRRLQLPTTSADCRFASAVDGSACRQE